MTALPALLRRTALAVADDCITLYAAQASFFILLSAVPFLSLLIAAAGLLLPADLRGLYAGTALPSGLDGLLGGVLTELRSAPNVSLLSLSAVTTLWSASRGTAAIRRGLERIYRAGPTGGFWRSRLVSLAVTLGFLMLLTLAIAVLLFGQSLSARLGLSPDARALLPLRFPAAFVLLCVLFTLIYASAARRSRRIRADLLAQLPGAAFSAVGCVLFSLLYSLYITHFPHAYRLYGGLAAVCLIMLWLYFCVIILLLGAQLNRQRAAGRR